MSSALNQVRPTALVRVTGMTCIEPNGTPVIGVMPPYSLPVPSVPIIGSTNESAVARIAVTILPSPADLPPSAYEPVADAPLAGN